MKFFTRSCLVAFAFLLVQSASASILVEPVLGYGMGSYKQGASDGKMSGVMFGGRAGYGFGPLILAADVMTGTQDIKPTAGGSTNADVSTLGVDLVFNPPMIPVRVWAGYIAKETAKATGMKMEGTGLKIGGGFSLIPMVSLNAEYIMTTFNKNNGATMTDLKNNEIFLSVSIPLSI